MRDWKDLGKIFSVEENSKWMHSHSSLPCTLDLGNDNFRIYFSTRNENGHSQPGYFEININNPYDIKNLSTEPILTVGPSGYFDSHGVYLTSVVRNKDKVYGYYGGWTSHRGGAFSSEIGLAISDDDGKTFSKLYDTPILQRNMFDPWALLAPSVFKVQDLWVMFYSTGSHLGSIENTIASSYHTSFATSKDGKRWSPTGIVSLGGESVSNTSRVTMCSGENGVFDLWYSFVKEPGGKYELGYAQSKNGFIFTQKKHTFYKNLKPEVWRGKSICYPHIFLSNNNQYMLYNGNKFGKTGIGLAIKPLP